MPDHVYRIIEVAGSSEKSIENAIENAVDRATRNLRQVGWFEVIQIRGHIEDGKVAHYQAILKVLRVHPRRRGLSAAGVIEGAARRGVSFAVSKSFIRTAEICIFSDGQFTDHHTSAASPAAARPG